MKRIAGFVLMMLLMIPKISSAAEDANSAILNENGITNSAQSLSNSTASSTAVTKSTAVNSAENGGNSISTSGDKNKSYANAWPSMGGEDGVSQGNIYSIFGGVGLSQTEDYKKYIEQIQVIAAMKVSGLISGRTAENKANRLLDKMMKSNKKQRFLGVGFETSGRNLINFFGILSWDSFWKDRDDVIDDALDNTEVTNDDIVKECNTEGCSCNVGSDCLSGACGDGKCAPFDPKYGIHTAK